MDLALNNAGDLDLTPSGELVLLDGIDAIAQHIRIRLRFFLGEWFLDQRVGIPYFQQLLGQKPNETAVKSIFRAAILSTPGIESISEMSVDFDGSTRRLGIAFTAITTGEETLTFDEELVL